MNILFLSVYEIFDIMVKNIFSFSSFMLHVGWIPFMLTYYWYQIYNYRNIE